MTYGADGRVIDDGSGKGHLGIEEQTHATFANVRAALESAIRLAAQLAHIKFRKDAYATY